MSKRHRRSAWAMLTIALCASSLAVHAAQSPGLPPPGGQRPPPPPPGTMPVPIGDWKPGDPRPPPPGAMPPPQTQSAANPPLSPAVTASTFDAAATTPPAVAPTQPTPAPPAPPAPTIAATPPQPTVATEPANAAPDVPPWPDTTPAAAVAAAPAPVAPERIVVDRVVTRDVPVWSWWATAALALLGLAWWRSQARARALAEESATLERRQRHLVATQRHLRERAEALQKTAVHDALTGTLTRQAFAGEFETAVAHAAHFGQPVALVMFDLDHFKQVNDTLGHAAGDSALKLVTGIVREKLTSNDLFGRFGGDEFLIGLIGNGGPDAMRVAEEIRASLARHVQEGRAPTRQLGISLGVAVADPESGYDVDGLFQRADEALYAAKRAGRNRAMLADRAVAVVAASPERAAEHAPRSLARS